MQDAVTSVIRTVVPYIIGSIVAWLAQKGVHVSDAQVASATAFLTFGVGTLYYVIVRWLEHKASVFGFLLGVPRKPVYATPTQPVPPSPPPVMPTPASV